MKKQVFFYNQEYRYVVLLIYCRFPAKVILLLHFLKRNNGFRICDLSCLPEMETFAGRELQGRSHRHILFTINISTMLYVIIFQSFSFISYRWFNSLPISCWRFTKKTILLLHPLQRISIYCNLWLEANV